MVLFVPICAGIYPWKKDFESAQLVTIDFLNKQHLAGIKVLIVIHVHVYSVMWYCRVQLRMTYTIM